MRSFFSRKYSWSEKKIVKLILGKISLFLFLRTRRSRAERNWNLNFCLETEGYLKNKWFRSTGRRADSNWVQVYPASVSAIDQVSCSRLPRHSTNCPPCSTTEHHGNSVSKRSLANQSTVNDSYQEINTVAILLVLKKSNSVQSRKPDFSLHATCSFRLS